MLGMQNGSWLMGVWAAIVSGTALLCHYAKRGLRLFVPVLRFRRENLYMLVFYSAPSPLQLYINLLRGCQTDRPPLPHSEC